MSWFDEWVGEEHKIVIIKLAIMSPFPYTLTIFPKSQSLAEKSLAFHKLIHYNDRNINESSRFEKYINHVKLMRLMSFLLQSMWFKRKIRDVFFLIAATAAENCA